MPILEIDWNPTKRKLRTFGAGAALLGLAAAFLLFRGGGALPWGAAGLGVLAGGTALAVPAVLRPLYVFLQVLTWPLGFLLGHLALGVVFYLVLTPLGLLFRVVGRDPLGLREKAPRESYWVPREERAGQDRYFRQF